MESKMEDQRLCQYTPLVSEIWYIQNQYPVTAITTEIAECAREIHQKNWVAAQEEWSDVMFMLWIWLSQRTGIDFRLYGGYNAYKKNYERMAIWQSIFQNNALKFYPKYLTGGANYMCAEKVCRALELAKQEQCDK